MKKLLLLSLLALMMCGCAHTLQDDLVGTWLRPDPNKSAGLQGFELKKKGKATAINIPKITYRTWYVSDNSLVFTGQDTSNGTPLMITDTYIINSVDKSMLVLITPSGEMRYYARQN